MIYAIERARVGYLNNVIRILFQRSINAFRPYRAVRFCREKAGNAAVAGVGSWTGEELTRVDIQAIGRLGRRGGFAGGELDTRKVTRYCSFGLCEENEVHTYIREFAPVANFMD